MMTTATGRNNTAAARLRILALCVIVLLLSACGTKMLYGRLDTMAGWYVGNLVSLDATQRSSLDRWLQVSLDWHRRSQLERYAAFLRDLEARLAAPLSYQDYEHARSTVESFWRDLVDGTVPRATELLASLSPAQVDELIASLESEDEEASEELARDSQQERLEKREKRLRRGIERWTGRLDPAQSAIVAASAAEMVPLGQAALDSRARWREQLRAALLESPDRAIVAATLLADPDQAWTDAYRDLRTHNRRVALEMLVNIDATLSRSQRDRMRARLGELAEDLESLARE